MAKSTRTRTKTKTKLDVQVPVHSRVAPKVEGAEQTEIKTTIEGGSIDDALKAFGLTPENAEQRFVYFFDTPAQKLLKAHVVVRARRVPGKQHDSTIKLRPVEPESVGAKWKKLKGFKIEADAGATGIVLSASLTRQVEKGLIKKLEAGGSDLAEIFDDEQERFLEQMCGVSVKLGTLTRFGPIAVSWWKTTYMGLPVPMTAELWTRGDGARLLELSIRVASGQAAFASGGFLAFLADLGAQPDNASQAKTKWAMEYRGDPIKVEDEQPPATKSRKTKTATKKLKAPPVKAKAKPKAPPAASRVRKPAKPAAVEIPASAAEPQAQETKTPKPNRVRKPKAPGEVPPAKAAPAAAAPAGHKQA